MNFYWLEDGDGIVIAHGEEAKALYRRTPDVHLCLAYRRTGRPPIGAHADTWIDAQPEQEERVP
jgi:hypothetical protein